MKQQHFEDFPQFTKPFVVRHVTGTGVMEDNFVFHGPISEHDTEEEAEIAANKLKYDNNSIKDIRSTWYQNRYCIFINTCTDVGKQLKIERDKGLSEELSSRDWSKYDEIVYDGITFYLEKGSMLDYLPSRTDQKDTYRIFWPDTTPL